MKATLHVTTSAPEPTWLAVGDWVVYLPELNLAPHGAPPLQPGRITYDQLLDLIFAADHVVCW
ncbi:MAG: hypothetical protein KBG15_15945 [Kofleriaceae bacterium]|nr:hypothetical protein [Kofleriaceae bacterium]